MVQTIGVEHLCIDLAIGDNKGHNLFAPFWVGFSHDGHFGHGRMIL
jgi:hypothetical protein